MIGIKFFPVVFKQAIRQRTRSFLTIAGVTLAMIIFGGVQAMQKSVNAATEKTAGNTRLIVYRKDRYCPATSRMPQSYTDRMKKVPGVLSAVPMRIVVNNCRTSLDVVTFRGVPEEDFIAEFGSRVRVVQGSIDDWKKRSDAVLLGQTLAQRRGLKTGDRFDAAGITVYVAGVIDSDEAQHQNVAYAHLSFIQFAAKGGQGSYVTMFEVRVAGPELLDSVAHAIDEEFSRDQDPTYTRSEQAFIAGAARDIVEIASFTRWLGWGCVVAVLALVSNALFLAVRQRVIEHAVLQTLGFRTRLIARMIVTEGMLLSLAGGLLGSMIVLGVLAWGRFSISVEGVSIPVQTSFGVLLNGGLMCLVVGLLAALWPAIDASRKEIVECFRTI
jgi:putative ABC transport system permease protein